MNFFKIMMEKSIYRLTVIHRRVELSMITVNIYIVSIERLNIPIIEKEQETVCIVLIYK